MADPVIYKKVKRTKKTSSKTSKRTTIQETTKYIDPGAIKADKENKYLLTLTGRTDEDDW